MAANFIPVDTTSRLGNKVRRLADLQREVIEIYDHVKAVMETQIDGGDYSAVEQNFGLPAGKGETAYNLVTAARAAVNVASVTQMIDWLG